LSSPRTAFAVCYTKLCRQEGLSLAELSALMSANPAAILGLNKGTLAVGADADVTLVDVGRPFVVEKEKLHSKSRNCPYDGETLYGRVYATVKAGRLTYKGE